MWSTHDALNTISTLLASATKPRPSVTFRVPFSDEAELNKNNTLIKIHGNSIISKCHSIFAVQNLKVGNKHSGLHNYSGNSVLAKSCWESKTDYMHLWCKKKKKKIVRGKSTFGCFSLLLIESWWYKVL